MQRMNPVKAIGSLVLMGYLNQKEKKKVRGSLKEVPKPQTVENMKWELRVKK